MKEIKLREIKPGMIIHCKTLEQIEEVLAHIGNKCNAEKIWNMRDSYGRTDCIRVTDEDGGCIHCNIKLCEKNGYEVTEFTDLILPETMTEEEAYKKGREDALEEVKNCEAYGYDCGLKEAWELAKKMVLNTYDGGIDAKELEKMFGVQDSYTIFKENDVKDVLAKVEAYEKEKEIKQWDVVEYGRNNIKILVTEINEETFSGIKITPTDEFGKFGGVYSARNLTDCKKTNYKADLSAILAEIGKE